MSHEFIVVGNVRICQRCDTVLQINMIVPVLVSGIRNNNSSILDDWLYHQASSDNDWQTSRAYLFLAANSTLEILLIRD
ncbi:MAG: hypothetical protein FWE36_07845 [Erysipelotrichales bacterium]|nr:hypothetical protein [Erysipelotrichales bacterium]